MLPRVISFGVFLQSWSAVSGTIGAPQKYKIIHYHLILNSVKHGGAGKT